MFSISNFDYFYRCVRQVSASRASFHTHIRTNIPGATKRRLNLRGNTPRPAMTTSGFDYICFLIGCDSESNAVVVELYYSHTRTKPPNKNDLKEKKMTYSNVQKSTILSLHFVTKQTGFVVLFLKWS